MANVKELYAKISATAAGFDKVMSGVENKTRDVAKSVNKQSSFMNKSLSGIGNVGKSFENMSSKLQGVSKTTGDLGSKFNSSITKPAGVAMGAVGGLVGALGFKRLMGMDAAEAKLKGLGYAGKDVETIQGQVETAIQGSMTTMAEGTDIAAGGLAAGVEKGKDLEQYIKLVGDAAVGSGRPVNEMAQIFARVQGSGKVMTEELNMVEEGMPGFAKAMADDMGIPLDEFREKVTNGEVSSEQFMKTMDSFAGKMSGEYAKSFEGMTKNTMAFVGQIGEKILGGAFEKSKKSLNEFLGWISSPEVQNGATRLGEKFGVAFNIIINAVSGAVKWFANLPGPVLKTVGAFGMLLVAVGPVLTLFSKITGMIAGLFGPFGKLLGLLAGMGPVGWIIMGVVAAIAALGTAFYVAYQKSETFRNFINGIGSMISGAIGWIKQFGQAIGALFGGDQKEGTSILKRLGFNEEQIAALQDMVNRVKSMFTTMGQTLGVVFGRIGKTWQGVAQAFQGAIPLFQLAFQNLLGIIMPLVNMIGNQIKIIFGAVVGIVQGAMRMVQGIIQIFSGLIQGNFGLMWQGIKNVFMGAINILWSLVRGLFFTLINIVTGLGGMLIGVFRAIFNTFKPIVMAVWNGIKFATIYVWNGIKNAVVTSIQTLKLRATQILNALKWIISGIWNGIKFVSIAIWNGIKWAVINAVNGLKIAAIATFNGLKWAISGIFNGIKFIATAVWNGIKWVVINAVRGAKNIAIATFNVLKFAITAIWNGIKYVTTAVWNGIKWAVVNAARGLKNIAISTFNILKAGVIAIWNGIKYVTSTVWNWIKNRVISLVRTLRTTVIAVFNALRSGVTAIWNGIKAVTSAVWNWIKNRVISLARTLRSTVVAVFNALRSSITGIWNAVKSITSAAWNWIKNKVIALARALRNTVVNVFNAFKNTISNIWNAIKGFTSRIWNGIKSTVINLATGLKNAVVSRFNTLKNAVSGIWNKVKSTAINMWQGIKDKITGFATGIKDGVVNTFNKMKDTIGDVIGGIKGFINDMVDNVKGGLNKLIGGVNKVGKALGLGDEMVKPIKMHTGTQGARSGFVRNGKISKDTPAIVNDKGKGNGKGRGGRQEIIKRKNGSMFAPKKRNQLVGLRKGDEVINGRTTQGLMNSGAIKFASGTGKNIGDYLNDFKAGAKDKAVDAMHGVKSGSQKALEATGNAAKGAGNWFKDKIGDIMDWAEKPKELLNKILENMGVNFDFLKKGSVPGEFMGAMFNKLKKGAVDLIKSWFEEASGGEGDAGWLLKHDIWQKFGAYTGGLGFNGGQHYGVDFGMTPGTPIKAVAGGKVSKVWNDYGGGKSIEVDIGKGLTNWYMHLSKQLVSQGDKVGVGDLIAKSGNTGNFTAGSGHLHFQLNKNGKPQSNVLEWLKGLGGGGKKKPSSWGSTIDKAANKMGVKLSGSQRKGIIAQIARESNGDAGVTQGNIGDINNLRGTPAQGLLQYVPSTFKSYAVKGHKNIKSGYDQLLAFFNNSNWARDLAYGKSGWGPSGANRGYANGGIINAPEMAWLAEGGFSESVISHDPRQRTRSKAIHDKTGKMLGVDDETPLLREIIDILEAGNQLQSQNNNATRQLLNKEVNVYLNRKKITEEVNRESANIFDGQLYNQGG